MAGTDGHAHGTNIFSIMNGNIFKSPKTTWAAILSFIAILATQVGYLLDADPATTINWQVIAAQVPIIWGLIVARDNDKTSEAVGVKKEEKKLPPPPNARELRGSGRPRH